MSIAFLYAGQGSQQPGMGADLHAAEPVFARAFDELDPDGSLRELCFHGSLEELSDTRNTQPCMVACALATTALLTHAGITADMVAGLSLGEYPALAAAGVLDPACALDLARFRGDVMAKAVVGRRCGMAAVLGLDREPLRAACRAAADVGVVEPTNYNCPGQIVISGDAAAVERACELALAAGARKCIPLAVSGPFHTSLMKPAGDALHERLRDVTFGEERIPVVFNATARTRGEGETVASLLERQVQSSVYFEDSVRFMAAAGVDTFIEIGPGRTLSKFVRKTVPGCRVANVEDEASYRKTLEEVADAR